MDRIKTTIRNRLVWVSVNQSYYRVGTRRNGHAVYVDVVGEPTERAYRQTLTTGVPFAGEPSFPWWQR